MKRKLGVGDEVRVDDFYDLPKDNRIGTIMGYHKETTFVLRMHKPLTYEKLCRSCLSEELQEKIPEGFALLALPEELELTAAGALEVIKKLVEERWAECVKNRDYAYFKIHNKPLAKEWATAGQELARVIGWIKEEQGKKE